MKPKKQTMTPIEKLREDIENAPNHAFLADYRPKILQVLEIAEAVQKLQAAIFNCGGDWDNTSLRKAEKHLNTLFVGLENNEEQGNAENED